MSARDKQGASIQNNHSLSLSHFEFGKEAACEIICQYVDTNL